MNRVESLARVANSRRERPGAGKRRLRLVGSEAAGMHHRLAVAGLKLEPALARCGGVFALVALRERRKQRLRFPKLGHFGCERAPPLPFGRGVGGEGLKAFLGWPVALIHASSPGGRKETREAFERRREDGVGFDGAGGRSVELGERERGAQFEAARSLPFRDRDGGLERFLGSRRIGWVTLQQHFAADAMQFCFDRAISCLAARRQRFFESRQGVVDIAGLGFDPGKRNLQQSIQP
jgi:hypothetical protein